MSFESENGKGSPFRSLSLSCNFLSLSPSDFMTQKRTENSGYKSAPYSDKMTLHVWGIPPGKLVFTEMHE